MNMTADELAMLNSITTVTAWNDFCDQVKDARQGVYPSDWWEQTRAKREEMQMGISIVTL